MVRRALQFGIVGAASGAVAAIASSALMPKMTLESMGGLMAKSIDARLFTWYDKPWGIVGHLLLGLLVSGTVAILSVRSGSYNRKLAAFLIGGLLGAGLCWLSAYATDQLMLSILISRTGGTRIDLGRPNPAMDLSGLLWYWTTALALTMPVFLGAGANRFLFVRSLIGAVLSAGIGAALAHLVFTIVLPAMAISVLSSGSPEKLDLMAFVRPIYIGMLLGMGAGAGMAFGFVEAIWKAAWLKSYGGPTEGRTWNLGGPLMRIGSLEGIEVSLPQDGLTAPVHAQIQGTEDSHFLTDFAGTTVNGSPATGVWLKDGDRIGVGGHQLVYRSRLAPSGRPAGPVPAPQNRKTALPSGSAPDPAATRAPQQPSIVHRTSSIVHSEWRLLDPLGRKLEVKPGTTVIGRDPACGLVLSYAQTVSRRHAELTLGPQGLTILDLGSSNGTFVNEAPATGQVELREGDELRLGSCVLAVHRAAAVGSAGP